MTVVIKKVSGKRNIDKMLSKLKRRKGLTAHKFCGVIKLREDPMEIQNKLRDEWK